MTEPTNMRDALAFGTDDVIRELQPIADAFKMQGNIFAASIAEKTIKEYLIPARDRLANPSGEGR